MNTRALIQPVCADERDAMCVDEPWTVAECEAILRGWCWGPGDLHPAK